MHSPSARPEVTVRVLCADATPRFFPPTPTVYFAMRERQLAYQCRLAQERGVNAWRRPLASHGCTLLQRRGRAQLQVRVPAPITGLTDQQAPVVLLRELVQPLRQHRDLASNAQPPAAAAAAEPADMESSPPASAQPARPPPLALLAQQHTSTPPQGGELPAASASPLALPPPPSHAVVVIDVQPMSKGSQASKPDSLAGPGSGSLASAMAGWLRRTASTLLSPPPSCSSALH